MKLDPATIYFVVVSAAAVTAGLLWLLGRQSPTREVARSWAVAFAALSMYFGLVITAGALPPLIGIGLANGLAIGVMGAMHHSACVLCRQSFRPWPHAVAAMVVTVVVSAFLLDAASAYDARVQLVGSVTALQCAFVAATMNRRDAETGDEEMFGRRVAAVAFAGLGALQLTRVLAHSPIIDVIEPAILAQTPLAAGVASGFLCWTLIVPILLFHIHEARGRQALRTTVGELRNTLAEVKTLRELLPMCASCRRIRDDGDEWSSLEKYLVKNAGVQISHGLCSECMARLYPEFIDPGKS